MNQRAHWLSIFAAIAHLVIGVPELLNIGPRFLPVSWAILYAILPGWIRPVWLSLFILTGLVLIVGIRSPGALRLGLYLSSFIFLIWGLLGLESWRTGTGGNIPGATSNLYIAGCAWVLAHYVAGGVKADVVNIKVAELGEVVHQIEEERRADEAMAHGG